MTFKETCRIDTLDGLEALPENTVIIDSDGDVMRCEESAMWKLFPDGPAEGRLRWWVADGDDRALESSDVALPARVLVHAADLPKREPTKWEPLGYISEDGLQR